MQTGTIEFTENIATNLYNSQTSTSIKRNFSFLRLFQVSMKIKVVSRFTSEQWKMFFWKKEETKLLFDASSHQHESFLQQLRNVTVCKAASIAETILLTRNLRLPRTCPVTSHRLCVFYRVSREQS